MPVGEVATHQRTAHADLLARRQVEYTRALKRATIIVAPAGAALFLALFIPGVVLGISEPGWYVGLVLIGLLAIGFAPLALGYKGRRAYVEAFGDLLESCPVCDAKIPSLKRRAHLSAEHPAESRRLQVVAILVMGPPVVILLGFIAFLWGMIVGIFPFVPVDPSNPLLFIMAALWVAVLGLWGILVERPHMARVRAAWRASHGEVQQNQ